MNRLLARLTLRRDSERGAILVIAAVGIVVAMISASLAVDIGSIAHEKRVVQKVADLGALDAVRDLANAQAVAERSASRNLSHGDSVVVVPGVNPKALIGVIDPVTKKFVAQAGGTVVQVTATSTVKNFFPFTAGPHTVSATALATVAPEAEFSVGSTLASVDTQKSVLDPVLGKMLGGATAVNMSAVSYSGLATGDVTLAALQTQLLAMGYDVGTPTKLLATNIGVADLLTATATALGPSTAATEINHIVLAQIQSGAVVTLGKLVYLATPGSASALETKLNVFRILTGAAEIENGTNFVDVPGIDLTLPAGLGTVKFRLSVIEPAQTAKGPVGTVAKTSQVKLQLHIDLLKTGVLALLAPVSLDLDFGAATANGTLTNITCGAASSITIAPTTSGATVSGTGTILPPLGGTLTPSGSLAATAAGAPRLFNYTTDFAPPVGSDSDGQHVGAATLILSPATVTVAGSGGLLAGTVAGVVQTLLPTILAAVDLTTAPLLQPVLQRLGLDVAGADIQAIDIFPTPPACGGARLIG